MKFQLEFLKKNPPGYRRGLRGTQYSTVSSSYSSVTEHEKNEAIKDLNAGNSRYKFDVSKINSNYNLIKKDLPQSKGKLLCKNKEVTILEINSDNLQLTLDGIMSIHGHSNGQLKLLIETMLDNKISSVEIEFELL